MPAFSIIIATVVRGALGVLVALLACLAGCHSVFDIVMTKDERGIKGLYSQNVTITQVQINDEAKAFPRAPYPKKYQDKGNGIFTDIRTGLMWIRKPFLWLKWEEARARRKDISSYPYRDWRLPTRVELASIIDINHKILFDTPDRKYFKWVRQGKHDKIWTRDIADFKKDQRNTCGSGSVPGDGERRAPKIAVHRLYLYEMLKSGG